MTILDTIVAHKREEVAARKLSRPLREVQAALGDAPPLRDFRAALLSPALPAPRVITEIKRRSPSKGDLLPGMDPAAVAHVYEANGAAAISVLADNRFFGGSLQDLRVVSKAVALPVLCKEFIIDPYQIYEAREHGASAVLLLASVLSPDLLREYRLLAASLGMASLVEVHDRAELDAAIVACAEIIGINNRDLRTLDVSLDTTRLLRPLVPRGVVVVTESGIHTEEHRRTMAGLGVDAMLVGESLVTAPDIAAATRRLTGSVPVELEGSLT
jgi:indole-3-glycerol phosphate synthase